MRTTLMRALCALAALLLSAAASGAPLPLAGATAEPDVLLMPPGAYGAGMAAPAPSALLDRESADWLGAAAGAHQGALPSLMSSAEAIVAEVPIPAALPLAIAGLGLLGWVGRRRARRDGAKAAAAGVRKAARARRRAGMAVPGRNPAEATCPRARRERATVRAGASGAVRFDELAGILAAMPGVARSRSFGRDCLKWGKKPFVVCDADGIAFKVGLDAAARLVERHPGLRFWNPKGERRAKLAWVLACADDVPALAAAAEAAYDLACAAPAHAMPSGAKRPRDEGVSPGA